MAEGIAYVEDSKKSISASGLLVNIDDIGICLKCDEEDKILEFEYILSLFQDKDVKISFTWNEKVKEEK